MSRGRLPGLLALALTVAAVGIPAGAWWIAGSREAQREAARLRAEAQATSRGRARDLAVRLGTRLGRLLDVESRRPFYQYRNLYHDPTGASAGPSIVPSPLADAPSDPLVRAYFQLDSSLRATLPALNDALPELNRPPALQALCALRDDIAGAAPDIATSVRIECPESSRRSMGEEAWRQMVSADSLYQQLRSRKSGGTLPPLPAADSGREVLTCVGPLLWRTLRIGGRDELAAIRLVETPDGPLVQGVLVDQAEASASLPDDARLAPGPGSIEDAADIPLMGTSWHVEVDARRALAIAANEARAARAAFSRTFAAGLSVAVAAGMGVLLLASQARRLARRREDFAAAAAHELRTPLAALRLHGGLLAEGLGDASRTRVYARHVSGEADRLSRVVTNLLTFTLRERGELGLRIARHDVGQVVASQVERQLPALEAAGFSVVLAREGDGLEAWCDREAISQVISNLLDNGARHAAGAADPSLRVLVRSALDATAVEVSVEDAGPGVPRRERERIFVPFARRAGRRDAGGLGLGLALSRSIARACGGNLACEGAAGSGARFVLRLPAAPRDDQHEA